MSSKNESKLGKTMSFRINPRAKKRFELLPIDQKHIAYRNLREVIARAIHNSEFVASKYLIDDEEEE